MKDETIWPGATANLVAGYPRICRAMEQLESRQRESDEAHRQSYHDAKQAEDKTNMVILSVILLSAAAGVVLGVLEGLGAI